MTCTVPTEAGENVLDSRDLAQRQQEIEDEFELDYEVYPGPAEFAAHIRETDEDMADEYELLYAVNEDGHATFGAGDWDASGITLIRDDHFEKYAEQLAEDTSSADFDSAHWPFCYIDWSAAADDLKQDYTYVHYDGQLYWGRA